MSRLYSDQPSRPLAVVLASGGLDSCVTTAIAAQDFELAMLHVSYGQRTEKRERQAFQDICNYYGVPPERRLIVSIEHLKKIGGSSLTDQSIPVPSADVHRQDIPSSYVPFRNAHLLSIAVSWAEVLGASAIFIGAVEEDSSGYPDCRESFFQAFQRAVQEGTKPETHISIHTPLIHLRKHEIVQKGLELGAPLHLTWSCYKNEEKACGECDSCALRLRAFQKLGVRDPIPYEKYPIYWVED